MLDESQVGIRTAGRNTNILIYVDDTTLMAESKEELKNLLMRVKEESEKTYLKINIKKQTNKQTKKTEFMASGLIVLCLVSCVQLFMTSWTVTHQAPLSMEIL